MTSLTDDLDNKIEIDMARLRVGCIVDGSNRPFGLWQLIQRAERTAHYSIDALIVLSVRRKCFLTQSKLFRLLPRHATFRTIERAFFAAIQWLERIAVLKVLGKQMHRQFFKAYSLEDIVPKRLFVDLIASATNEIYTLSAEVLDELRTLKLDILVQDAGSAFGPELASAARLGVISIYYGTRDLGGCGPPGFWEAYNCEPSTGFEIHFRSRNLESQGLVFRGAIPTSFLYLLNRVRLNIKANARLALELERLATSGKQPIFCDETQRRHPLLQSVCLTDQLKYLVGVLFYAFCKTLGKVQGKATRWGVAYHFVEGWRSVDLSDANAIANPVGRFLADPFVVVRDGRSYCFVEDFDFTTTMGKITVWELFKDRYQEVGTAIEEAFHVSYPFTFQNAGTLYMCPETHAAADIRIYRCVSFPLRWELHRVLMRGVSAADTSLFWHNGRWWMLTNLDTSELGDHCSELHIFYAERFDSEHWTPHPENPVIFDPARARNGGLIIDGDEIYRVFQVHGFDAYGASMGIARIVELSTSAYREEIVRRIQPDFFSDLRGTHSFSYANGVAAIDFLRFEKTRT